MNKEDKEIMKSLERFFEMVRKGTISKELKKAFESMDPVDSSTSLDEQRN